MVKKHLIVLAIIFAIIFSFLPNTEHIYAQDSWKAEFDDICSKTDIAMTFTKEELNVLIDRCDKLKTIIETLDESQKKVYLKRLKMCRDMFKFAIESKKDN